MRYLLALACILYPHTLLAQGGQGGQPAPQIQYVTVAPSGACGRNNIRLLTPNGVVYTCQSGTWTLAGGPPSGTAGGNLTGTYPNPGVKGVRTGLISALPATCTIGDIYFATDATAGANIYQCTATNTWTAPSAGALPAGSAGARQSYLTSSSFTGDVSDLDATAFGCTGDGSTDNTTCINNALTALNSANGGILRFPAGNFVVNSCITLPNDGGSPQPTQKSMRITGAGAGFSFESETLNGGTRLSMKCSSGAAQIVTLGRGYFELDHVALSFGTGGGAITVPLFLTTNTIANIHDVAFFGNPSLGGATNLQDAIVLGGGGSGCDGTITGGFCGYGTTVTNNWFDFVSRLVYFNGASPQLPNGIQITNNIAASSSGSSDASNGTAIDIQGVGSYIAGNLIEGTYKWGMRARTGASNNMFSGNSFFDMLSNTALYRFDSGASSNFALHAYPTNGTVMSEGSAGANFTLIGDTSVTQTIGAIFKFSAEQYFSAGARVGRDVAFEWAANTDPTSACTNRIQEWDTHVLAISDCANIRNFDDWRMGALYAWRPVVAQGSNISISATDRHNTLFQNSASGGQIDFTLPASPQQGTTFSFSVDDAQIEKIIASGSQVIRVGTGVTAAGGNVQSATQGSTLRLVYVASNLWVAESVEGTWTVN